MRVLKLRRMDSFFHRELQFNQTVNEIKYINKGSLSNILN